MGTWVTVSEQFIEADVIRWCEPVFKPRRGKARAVKLGQRLVAAEVIRREGDWVLLLIRDCQLLSVQTGVLPREVPLLQKGSEVKRKRATITRAKAERLLWSDESVRSVVSSKFLGPSA